MSQALGNRRESLAPGTALERAERLFGRLGTVGLVDGFERCSQWLALFPAGQPGGASDQVHDALRVCGGDGFGKTFQAVDNGDDDVAKPAGLAYFYFVTLPRLPDGPDSPVFASCK